jgi:hypothetical protein
MYFTVVTVFSSDLANCEHPVFTMVLCSRRFSPGKYCRGNIVQVEKIAGLVLEEKGNHPTETGRQAVVSTVGQNLN